MDIEYGEVTVETVPNTSLNLFSPDGNLSLPVESQANTIKVTVVNRKTVVQTLAGQAQFNKIIVSAGETYPLTTVGNATTDKPTKDDDSSNKSKGLNPLLIVGALGAVAAVVLVVLSSSSSGGNDTPVVSPTR